MPVVAFKKENTLQCCQTPSPSLLHLLTDRGAKVRHVRRDEPPCLTIDPAESIYYVSSGCVKLVRYSADGDEVMIDQYQAGSIFGNLCFCNWSLCCEGIDREIAVALEDSEILVTTFEALKGNISRHPEALVTLLEDFCRRLAVARLRIESLILHEAEERLARLLQMMAAYQQRDHNGPVMLDAAVTHEELAHLIGVTRPFVTKLVGQLRDRGLIESVAKGRLLVHQDRIAKAYS